MSRTNPADRGSSRRAGPVQGGADRYEALLEVLEQQAARVPDEDGPPPGRRGRSVAVAVLAVITAWLWLMPPTWLVPPAPPPRPLAEEEAALRFTMYLQAQRIRVYELEHGELPATLTDAGEPAEGLSYDVLAPGLYELVGTTDRLRLTYRSDEPLRDWATGGAPLVDERVLP